MATTQLLQIVTVLSSLDPIATHDWFNVFFPYFSAHSILGHNGATEPKPWRHGRCRRLEAPLPTDDQWRTTLVQSMAWRCCQHFGTYILFQCECDTFITSPFIINLFLFLFWLLHPTAAFTHFDSLLYQWKKWRKNVDRKMSQIVSLINGGSFCGNFSISILFRSLFLLRLTRYTFLSLIKLDALISVQSP